MVHYVLPHHMYFPSYECPMALPFEMCLNMHTNATIDSVAVVELGDGEPIHTPPTNPATKRPSAMAVGPIRLVRRQCRRTSVVEPVVSKVHVQGGIKNQFGVQHLDIDSAPDPQEAAKGTCWRAEPSLLCASAAVPGPDQALRPSPPNWGLDPAMAEDQGGRREDAE